MGCKGKSMVHPGWDYSGRQEAEPSEDIGGSRASARNCFSTTRHVDVASRWAMVDAIPKPLHFASGGLPRMG